MQLSLRYEMIARNWPFGQLFLRLLRLPKAEPAWTRDF
jgi:hypothetical protein